MIYKNFKFVIIVHVGLITIFIWLFFWALHVDHLKFTVYGFAIIAVILTILLILIVLRTLGKITLFLDSFIVNEPFPKFRSGLTGNVFSNIEQNLNKIALSYSSVKTEMEESYQFLEELLGQIETMIIVYNTDGTIKLVNPVVKKLFETEEITSLEQIPSDYFALYEILNSQRFHKPYVIKLVVHNEPKKFSVNLNSLKLRGQNYKMAILQDISFELDREEVKSWEKLIRILRHEIINSITPITTIAATLVSSYEEEKLPASIKGPHHKTISNTLKGLKAIDKRGNGLIDFVKNYKDISTTIKPELRKIQVNRLFTQVETLVGKDCETNDILLKLYPLEKDLFIMADEKQIIQVLLNLVRNAIEALEREGNKHIGIGAYKEMDNVVLTVSDNGKGIEAEELENIFVPFYTTKANGSGIGLSISKSIMQKHEGTVLVRSEKGKETIVSLMFVG